MGTVLYACDTSPLASYTTIVIKRKNKFIEHHSHANALHYFASLAMTNDRTGSAINPPTVNAGSTPRGGV